MLKLNDFYNYDFFEFMKQIDDHCVNMIACDLPYGVTDLKKWDNIIPMEKMWEEFKRVLVPKGVVALTATEPFATHLRNSNMQWYKYDWYWIKSKPTMFIHAKNRPLRQVENVLIFSDGSINHESVSNNRMPYFPQMNKGKPYKSKNDPEKTFTGEGIYGKRPSHRYIETVNEGTRYPTDVLEIASVIHDVVHPTQKPIELFKYLINTYTEVGQLVIDPTAGSGTTGLAALLEERNFLCNDFDPKWVAVAKERTNNIDPFKPKVTKSGATQLSLFGEEESVKEELVEKPEKESPEFLTEADMENPSNISE